MGKIIKTYWGYAIVVLAIIAAVIWFFARNPHEEAVPNSEAQKQEQQQASTPAPAATTTTKQAGSSWEGVLKESNNRAKGNLMLATPERNIYLKTSRDFSSLIGKKVIVTYEGSLDSFVLGNITAAE